MKTLITLIAILLLTNSLGQLSESEVGTKRNEHAEELNSIKKGILNQEEITKFKGLDYFSFDATYQIEVKYVRNKGPKFEMATSTDRKPIYRQIGFIEFELNGSTESLNVYQNVELSKSKEYKNYLFIPFRDKTSGNETYGGGRYLDIEKQKGKVWKIDFNLAYNPYCAYSYRYSCPIPPKENTLNIKIEAGEKVPHSH